MKTKRIIGWTTGTILVLFQYPLWLGSGSLLSARQLKREIAEQQVENAHLAERNRTLAAEVVDLKQGLEAIEERARHELGMVKQGETFFQVIETPPSAR